MGIPVGCVHCAGNAIMSLVHNVIELMKQANDKFPDDRQQRIEWYARERAHMDEKVKKPKNKKVKV